MTSYKKEVCILPGTFSINDEKNFAYVLKNVDLTPFIKITVNVS